MPTPVPGDPGHARPGRLLGVDDLLLEREVHPAVLARPTRPARSWSTAVAHHARCHASRASRPLVACPDGARRTGLAAGRGTRPPCGKNSTLFSRGRQPARVLAHRRRRSRPRRDRRRRRSCAPATASCSTTRAPSPRGLHALGLRPGDAVAVVLPNHRTFLGCWLAATEIGLYFVPVNSHLAPAEAAFVVANSEAKVLVGHDDLADLVPGRGAARPASTPTTASRSGSRGLPHPSPT